MHQVYFNKHNPTFRYANDQLQKICTNKSDGDFTATFSAVHLQWETPWKNGGGSVRITGFQESLQFSSVSRSLFKIPAHMHAGCDLDRNRLAFQVSRKISITCPELHKTDKCNGAEMESDGGISVQARRTMTHWRHFTFSTHEHVRETGASCHTFYSSVFLFLISQWIQTVKSLLQKSYEHVHHSCLENTVHWMHIAGHVVTVGTLFFIWHWFEGGKKIKKMCNVFLHFTFCIQKSSNNYIKQNNSRKSQKTSKSFKITMWQLAPTWHFWKILLHWKHSFKSTFIRS